jgi:hypothetical protein
MVEHLPNMCKALGSIPAPKKKKKRKQRQEIQGQKTCSTENVKGSFQTE